ncbi:hypothetical protein EVAR_20116_1 [Eumeta japonica]|uniref:Reverse transcriptase domain-containing protein n=1 Tax=Eumeta variegata TaxID=151549 RepID=A0A4C1V296_EUMVA|nr:hypothetical protein EVAR_20116_1 [Eumeta japonica]
MSEVMSEPNQSRMQIEESSNDSVTPRESYLVSKNTRQSYGLDKKHKVSSKEKGSKQGCPLSPRLFAIVLDDVLRTLEELVSEWVLKLNETKTKMLVRDPINKSIAKQTQEINGVLITPVDAIKYLGTYLISELS